MKIQLTLHREERFAKALEQFHDAKAALREAIEILKCECDGIGIRFETVEETVSAENTDG